MPDVRPHIFDLTPDELTARLAEAGMPAFRAKQVLDWVYHKDVTDPEAMTNLSRADRQTLKDAVQLARGRVVRHELATDATRKLLVEWQPTDAAATALPTLEPSNRPRSECVMIPADGRRTACISSQVGCPVGCRFCASGLGGLDENLSAGQIIEQVHHLNAALQTATPSDDSPRRITNVVFMGMGEPLANFDAVRRAIQALTAAWGFNLSARKVTVSTVGLPAQIRRLAEIDLPITLALSLHAPNDTLRRELIPWADYVTISQLLSACRAYFNKTGREITLEYILLGGVNDEPKHADQLADLVHTLRCNVNLIRYNEVPDLPYRRPDDESVRQFQARLRKRKVNAHIRASRGRDIAAACGQLHREASRHSPVISRQ